MLLLNPGPVTLTERVRKSLLQADLCHRESEFFDLQDEARTRLVDVYGLDATKWSATMLTGSGTAAVESMVAALVPRDGKLLVVQNGAYGERIVDIAKQYGIAHEALVHDWTAAPDLDRIAARLDADRTISHVAAVHHETTSGRLNDIDAIGRLCNERGVRLLVDMVSSFGAEPLDFESGAIAAVAAGANKCLHGVPGAAFVIARQDTLDQAVSRTYYLDLARLARLQSERNTPFTPAVHAYYALVEALREFHDEGGWPARHAHYAALAERVRAGFASLGIEPLLPPQLSSVVLRAYHLPHGMTFEQLHDGLKMRGFVIYPGQRGLYNGLFRVSTMGAIEAGDIDRLLDGVRALTR